jgi:hypothetical protein
MPQTDTGGENYIKPLTFNEAKAIAMQGDNLYWPNSTSGTQSLQDVLMLPDYSCRYNFRYPFGDAKEVRQASGNRQDILAVLREWAGRQIDRDTPQAIDGVCIHLGRSMQGRRSRHLRASKLPYIAYGGAR